MISVSTRLPLVTGLLCCAWNSVVESGDPFLRLIEALDCDCACLARTVCLSWFTVPRLLVDAAGPANVPPLLAVDLDSALRSPLMLQVFTAGVEAAVTDLVFPLGFHGGWLAVRPLPRDVAREGPLEPLPRDNGRSWMAEFLITTLVDAGASRCFAVAVAERIWLIVILCAPATPSEGDRRRVLDLLRTAATFAVGTAPSPLTFPSLSVLPGSFRDRPAAQAPSLARSGPWMDPPPTEDVSHQVIDFQFRMYTKRR